MTKLKNNENEKKVSQLKYSSDFIKDDHIYSITKSNSNDLLSLKIMMTCIIIAIILLIFGVIWSVSYKMYYSARRHYISANTVNTNIEQSLV